MKKRCYISLIAGISLLLGACGKTAGSGLEDALGEDGVRSISAGEENGGMAGNARGEQGGGGTAENAQAEQSGFAGQNGGLELLAADDGYGCHTQDGYYYLTEDMVELTDGSYGCHLMYVDFGSCQEVHLCSNAGCSHNSPDCQAVFLYDDFPFMSTRIFIYQDSLYILSRDFDNDGSMQTDFMAEGDGFKMETSPCVLYRAGLDGSGREKVYAFDPALSLEDCVMGDGRGLYLVAKKLTSERDGMDTYISSTERRLLFLDPVERKESTVCSLDFGDNVSWEIMGCTGDTVLLSGIDYGRELSREEFFDDDAYKELHENSEAVYATLSLGDMEEGHSMELHPLYRMSNREENSALAEGTRLYVSSSADGCIRWIDVNTGEEHQLVSRPGQYFYLYEAMGNKLCCKDGSWDETFYFVDTDTGEVSHSGLVNKNNGWSLEFRATVGSDVLVIYDYEATYLGNGSYDITRYQYGLISLEDLVAGRDNFRRINMVGKGV